MKKLFALITVILLCGYSFAQNISTVNETGGFNTANVNQTGSNTSTINQTSINPGSVGKSNDATVTQDGATNTSTILQDRSGGQQSNKTTGWVYQSGDNNLSVIQQDGYYQGSNSAKVTQIGVGGGAGNEAYQYQLNNYGNQSEIYQSGDENFGYQEIRVVASGNHDYIGQFGMMNTAYQYNESGDETYANINQHQNNNYAWQYQHGLKNKADIYQDGNSNKAYQEQSGGSYNPGKGHRATITQLGDDNYANQYQKENVSDSFAPSANNSIIYQEGSDNTSYVSQTEGLNIGNVTQVGDNNIGNIYQNTLSNTANINQNGVSNNAQVVQQ